MKPCVIFDLDGTLADTSQDLLLAANSCFDQMGLSVRLNPGADDAIAVRGARRMLTEGLTRAGAFDEAVVDAWYPKFLEVYAQALDVHTVLYPGAREAVEGLLEAGYAVGICTNKPAALAERVVQSLEVRHLFASLLGADSLPVKKPDPLHFWVSVDRAGGSREACLLVGDSDTDRKTAAAAGVPSVLVGFGPAKGAVAALKPEALLHSYDDMLDVTRTLIGAP